MCNRVREFVNNRSAVKSRENVVTSKRVPQCKRKEENQCSSKHTKMASRRPPVVVLLFTIVQSAKVLAAD